MSELITYLNNGNPLLPEEVKANLVGQFTGNATECPEAAARLLATWCVESMPSIAAYHGVQQDQVIDSLQHYRFGFRQAQKLTAANNATSTNDDLLAVFTIVHDLGRMMVGSGASSFRFPAKEGNLLHPIVGAMMLREAFSLIKKSVSKDVQGLLMALEYTAERHTLSIGLDANAVDTCELAALQRPPYGGAALPLFLADVTGSMDSKYSRYAHLAALADLVNNVSKPLDGAIAYEPCHAPGKTAVERVKYVIAGNDDGDFRVIRKGDTNFLHVERVWKNGIPIVADNAGQISTAMRESALRFCTARTFDPASEAFDRGWQLAFPVKD